MFSTPVIEGDTTFGTLYILHSIIEVTDLQFDISQAVPFGLMLSEILTNTFKHAFLNRNRGTVIIRTEGSPPQKLLVSDDGSGTAPDVDFNNPSTFGLKIIRLLSEQASARVTVDTSSGTAYTIEL